MHERYESFAAIAIFRELYNQKKDVYDILASIIVEVIANEKMLVFSVPEITERINERYSFALNEAVIKTSLKRMGIKRKNGIYTPSSEMLKETCDYDYAQQEKLNNALLYSLFEYIEQKSGNILTEKDKERIKIDFFECIMSRDINGEYAVLINQFMLSLIFKPESYSLIQKIKEGILIYEGICYSGYLNELGTWKSKLNIYFEQETLFYIAGYNGNVHQEMYNQLLKYISEINNNLRGDQKLIRLWFGVDVKDEIEAYFNAAERIIENREMPDPSKKPMMYILQDATCKSDILQKKVKFYNYLKTKGINLFEYDYHTEDNYDFNLINEHIYAAMSEKYSDRNAEYIKKCCDKINQIEILRKGNNKKLDNVGHILLTANGVIRNIAYESVFYDDKDVPKATSVDFLLNRFWFKLNKGFGEGVTPKTLDAIVHARIALSYLANEKVEKAYEDIKKEFEEQKISKEEAITLIAELRSYSKAPDEINGETIADEIGSISHYEVDRRVEELHREEIARLRDKNEIEELKRTILKMTEEQKSNYDKEQKEKSELLEIIQQERRNSSELDAKVQSLLEQQEEIKKQKLRNREKLKFVIRLAGLLFLAGIIFCVLVFIIKVENSIGGAVSIAVAILFGIPQIKNFLHGKNNNHFSD